MQDLFRSILICALLALAVKAGAQEAIPKPVNARFPNIRASLDDGFFALAEQQARGVLRSETEPSEDEAREAVLLLSHALWGQKRYSETLELLKNYSGDPAFVYWRARAHFELKQYDIALGMLALAELDMPDSPYAPAAIRLQGHMEQITGKLKEAEATYKRFAEQFPDHSEQMVNQFDLAEVFIAQNQAAAAIAIYEALRDGQDEGVVQRAQLKQAHVLYTLGTNKDYDTARSLLAGLASKEQVRLAYRIDAYIDLAALEEKDGKPMDAIVFMRKAIALSPDARQRVPLKLELARLLLRNDDITGALKLLEECRAEVPNENIAAELQLEKAKALLQGERFDESVEAYQVYLDVADDPDGLAHAYLGKGLALWELKRFAESAAVLDKATKGLTVPSEIADALFKAADAYYQAGKSEDAEKRYRSFVTDFPQHPNVPNALYQLGLALARTGRRSDALATFELVEKNHAQSEFAEKSALRATDVMLAAEQWEPALEKFTLIGQTYTNRSVKALSQHQRGLLLYRLGRYVDAENEFDIVVDIYPESEYAPQASYMRGFCLYLQGKVDEAIKTCHAFIESYPDSRWAPDVIFWLAEQFYNQGNYDKAEPLFLRIAADFNDHKLASRALYWAGRAVAAKSDPNYLKAIERYSKIARNYPDSEILPQTRFAHGDALTELGEHARAIFAFEEIIKNYPESYLINAAWGRKGDCQFSLAQVTDNPARYTEAMHSYQIILDRPSASTTLKLQAEFKIGRCLEKTNMPTKAFNRYMNVVYTFINENIDQSNDTLWCFTRSATYAATIKEKEKSWKEAVKVYERMIEANVPAATKDRALKRIEKIKQDNWLLFQQTEEMENVGTDH